VPVFRGHHLICLHFFNGEGYEIEFVNNLRDIMRVVEEAGVEICREADDICNKCPYLESDICKYDDGAEEEIQKMDAKALHLLECVPGKRIKWNELREKLPTIFPEWYISFCLDCNWIKVCGKTDLFQKVKP
jgi:hypothetical protein